MTVDGGLRELRQGRYGVARRAFEAAAAEGEGRAFLHLAQLASEGLGEPEDPARAALLYRRGAEAGCATAAYGLGGMYALGRGVARDAHEALRWFRRAAELGSVDGSFKVGAMLALGEVGAPTAAGLAEAERRWRQGAADGHVPSLLFLGHYYNGLGPTRAPGVAAGFYLEACVQPTSNRRAIADANRALDKLLPLLAEGAERGDADCAAALGGWHLVFTAERGRAAAWLETAAAAGHAIAERRLAQMLLAGDGVARDRRRALMLYHSAAAAGDRQAQLRLGHLYAAGEETARDDEMAIAYLQAAAEQGLPEAMAALADVLARVDRAADARLWWVRAAERGQPAAMRAAAEAFRVGLGGERDLVQAVRWYLALLHLGNSDGAREAHVVAERMTEAQIRQAARLAGDPADADTLLDAASVEGEGR